MNSTLSFTVLLEHFFTQRMMAQRRASPYRSAPIAIPSGCCNAVCS